MESARSRARILRARRGIIMVLSLSFAAMGLTALASTASAGSSTVSPSDDSYTSQLNPTLTHGPDNTLNTNSATSSDERRSWLKFSVSGIPAGATSVTASLSLYSQSAAGSGVTFTVYQTSTSWDEGTITWNNQPSLGSSVTTRNGLTNGARNTFDVSSLVTGNGTYSMAITSNDPTQRYFSSKEATGIDAYPPQLNLTWVDPVSPTVTTGSASDVKYVIATVGGTVNPNGVATTCHFDYGTTTSYGSSTSGVSAGSGTSAVAVSADLTSLAVGTGYHFRLSCSTAYVTSNGSDATFTTSSTSLLTRKDLIYGTEIPYNQLNGGPAVDTTTVIPGKIKDAKAEVVRFAMYDCFTGDTCGSDNHSGSRSKTDLDNMIKGIVNTLHAVPMLKLLPISKDSLGSPAVDGKKFCPPYDGSNDGMNLAMYKKQLDEIATVYHGPIILESSNEMEVDCRSTWVLSNSALTSIGSVGMSKRLGEIYAATMPQLKAYARDTLGFSQVTNVGYVGVGGGTAWGPTCTSVTVSTTYPYGYNCTYQARWVDEFNTAVKAAADAHGGTSGYPAYADYVPDAESIHAYPHSPDFTTTNPYSFDDNIAMAYYRNWIAQSRSRVNALWGTTIGNNILFSISEWNAGVCRNTTSDCWSGWSSTSTPTAVQVFYSAWMTMLQGDGTTTGSGTRYWEASNFVITGNGTTGAPSAYNMINQSTGVTTPQYDTWKSASVGDTSAH